MALSIVDPQLGEVVVSIRANSSRFTAKWSKGRVMIIAPRGASRERILRFIEQARPKLMEWREPQLFETGRPLELDGGITIKFARTGEISQKVRALLSKSGATIQIASDLPEADPQLPGLISRVMMKVAVAHSPSILIPRAKEIADSLGLRPAKLEISRGHKILGHCNARKEIAISAACLFLPWELRDYVICHELAHLTEMNHSERFHALCDRYCGGREKELIRKLKAYKWPILR